MKPPTRPRDLFNTIYWEFLAGAIAAIIFVLSILSFFMIICIFSDTGQTIIIIWKSKS